MTLEKRLTHEFVGNCKHLELTGDKIADYTIMRVADIPDADENDPDPCDPLLHFLYLKVYNAKDWVEEDDIANGIYDEFYAADCHCSHDCCGCRGYWIEQIEKCKLLNYTHRNEDYQIWMVLIGSSRNY